MRRVLMLLVAGALGLLLGAPAQARVSPKKALWSGITPQGLQELGYDRTLGTSIIEVSLQWLDVAPRRPRHPRDPHDRAYRWEPLLTTMTRAAARRGMRVMVLVEGMPRWANGGRDWRWAPKKASDFGDFMAAAAREYPGVRMWMILGEPNRGGNFQPMHKAKWERPLTKRQAEAPRRYAQLLDAAYGAIKSVNPKDLVIGGSTYTWGDIYPYQWVHYMRLPNGRRPRLDLYAHNPFSFQNPDIHRSPQLCCEQVDFSALLPFSRFLDRNLRGPHGRPLRFFLSEFTVPTQAHDPEFPYWVDPPLQAGWIRSAWQITNIWKRIYALGWVHLRDIPQVTYGGLIYADGTPKPGLQAWIDG